MSTPSDSSAVVIVGGGLSGLTLAYELFQQGISFIVYESSQHLGGNLRTVKEDGYIVEQGPNGFLNNAPATLDLLRRLGLQDQVVAANSKANSRYIFLNHQLHKVPMSPPSLLKTKLLPFRSKIQIFKEPFLPHRAPRFPESIHDFVSRHFDETFASNLAAPFVVGVFAGDSKNLSVEHCFPKLVDVEKVHGSLFKGMIRRKSKGSVGRTQLMSLKDGMGQLVETLITALPKNSIRRNCPVSKIEFSEPNQKYVVSTSQGQTFARAVVLACPAATMTNVAADVLPREVVRNLKTIPAAPVRTLTLAFDGSTKFSGFGALLKREASSSALLGFLHPPDIFPHRAPPGQDLLTTLWGGAWPSPYLDLPLETFVSEAVQELEKVLGHKLPPVKKVWDWSHRPGIPQYTLEVAAFLDHLKTPSLLRPGLYLHSNVMGGVAMNECITKSVALLKQITMFCNNPSN